MIDEPKGTKDTYGYATGGWVAAPAVKRIISSMVSVLGLSPEFQQQGIETSLLKYIQGPEIINEENNIETH